MLGTPMAGSRVRLAPFGDAHVEPLRAACAEDPESGELLYRCVELIAQLRHISELEMPYYFNIL